MDIRQVSDRIDQKYLDGLASEAMAGSSDAFAALFTATSGRQLYYLTRMYGNRESAAGALADVYARACSQIADLGDPGLFAVWISRISLARYLEDSGREDRVRGDYGHLLKLPLIEAQVVMMRRVQGMGIAEIEAVLNMSRHSVQSFLRSAARRLGSACPGAPADATDTLRAAEQAEDLTPAETARILDEIFTSCGMDANTTPSEELSLYTIYRRDRFFAQRAVIAVMLVMFMLLPVCFISPVFTVEAAGEGARGLPEYKINVGSHVPAARVTAAIGDTELPVYEAGAGLYTAEPTANGILSVTVELANRQSRTVSIRVQGVDNVPPRLLESRPGDGTVILYAADDGIGVDYRGIYALDSSGSRTEPLSADEEGGIVFAFPEGEADIFIPDRLGNMLQLRFKPS